jgi:secreted trypsin-like serine protease
MRTLGAPDGKAVPLSLRRPRPAWISGLLAATLVLSIGAAASAVVGGTVPEDSLTFVAKIEMAGRACTGVLVDPQWVLTSSSCFADASGAVPPGVPKQATTATVGRTVLSGNKGRTVAVVDLVPHESRNVVLAKLATKVDIVPVAIAATAPADGETLRVAGYGRTADEWVPNRLHAAAFTVQAVQGTTVSITGATGDAAICKGDAGGPALRESGGHVELVAITSASWQHGCFGEIETRTGAVEIRVDDLAGWIGQHATHGGRGGDYNGDGRDDIVAGYDNLNTNTSFLGWRGAAAGISGNPETLWNSGNGNWANTQAKYVTGDFDGDGHGDVGAGD